MRPKTRSSNAKASSSKDKLPNKAVKQEETSDSDSDDDDLMAISIGNHLEQLSKQFKKMKREVKELRRRNDGLTQDLNDARAEAAENEPSTKKGKKAGPTAASLQKEVVALKSRIEQYEKTERKNKKTIEKLRQKELKKEADDLNDDAAGTLETEDSAYRLRTLLRRFGDIMAANSLEADEECGICVEVLEVNETVSFPCQHIMCEECFKGISPNKDEIKCPYCRRETARDEIETVRYTAASQWDELLKIAKNFAIMDHTYRREQDTSEEEEEEDFLNDAEDSEPASADVSSEHSEPQSALRSSSPETDNAQPSLPVEVPRTPNKRRLVISEPSSDQELDGHEAGPSNGLLQASSYTGSPAAVKRQKMEELAKTRVGKRPIR